MGKAPVRCEVRSSHSCPPLVERLCARQPATSVSTEVVGTSCGAETCIARLGEVAGRLPANRAMGCTQRTVTTHGLYGHNSPPLQHVLFFRGPRAAAHCISGLPGRSLASSSGHVSAHSPFSMHLLFLLPGSPWLRLSLVPFPIIGPLSSRIHFSGLG